MIKYPVYLGDPHMRPGYNLVFPVLCGGDAMVVAEALEKEDAEAIVNALNAMNEFPSVAVGSSWINAVLIGWFNKFFPGVHIHHTKERDCLCSDCADT
jgi:hypothetical protein